MPELPEVQTIVNELLSQGIIGRKIIKADVRWPKIIAKPTPEDFIRLVINQLIENISRRGKYIVIRLRSNLFLLIHLRMTGQLVLENFLNTDPHCHLVLELDNGNFLAYYDTRKFGRFYLVENVNEVLGKLGVEPLSSEFTVEYLAGVLKKHKCQLKPFLLNQNFIAGLGNIYSDEALFEAGLHPQRLTNTLTSKEIKSLHKAIQLVLRKGIANLGTSLGDGRGNYARPNRRRGRNQEELLVFRRTGKPCLKCGTTIQRIKVGQRSTHFCPKCQK